MSTTADKLVFEVENNPSGVVSTARNSIVDVDFANYPDALHVGYRLRIEQLSSIDTVSQSYKVRMTQVTDWLATPQDIENFEKEKENFTPSRIVKPLELNCVVEEVEYNVYSQFKGKDGKTYNIRFAYMNAEFTEEFECENFPFDVQDLSFIICTDTSINNVLFVPSRYKNDMLYINKSWLALCDWDIVFHVCLIFCVLCSLYIFLGCFSLICQ